MPIAVIAIAIASHAAGPISLDSTGESLELAIAGSPTADGQTERLEKLHSTDAISDAALADLRGGQSIVVSNQSLSGTVSGNVFNGDYVAGTVSLSDNALSNFNGLGNFAINTGAQVSLQSGMSVTINVGR